MSSTDALSRAWLNGPSAEPTGAVSVLPSAIAAKLHAPRVLSYPLPPALPSAIAAKLHAAIRTVLARPPARVRARTREGADGRRKEPE